MTYIIQLDDNNVPMLVDYDSGCGCCAQYRAVNKTEDETFYDTKYMPEGKVTEVLREQIAVLAERIRGLQQYALDNGHDIGRWGETGPPTPAEERKMAERHDTYIAAIDRLQIYEGDLG